MRFGLPTMPAEVSLYLLNFADRLIIIQVDGGRLAEAGLYSVAVKFAQAVNVLVRGFQLAWPPLAYSIRDDDEARRTYATVITLFLAVCTWLVVGLWLLADYLMRFFVAPEVLRRLRSGRPDRRRGHPLRALHGDGGDPRPDRAHRVQPARRRSRRWSPTSRST